MQRQSRQHVWEELSQLDLHGCVQRELPDTAWVRSQAVRGAGPWGVSPDLDPGTAESHNLPEPLPLKCKHQ